MPPPRLDMTLCSVLAWRWRPPSETLLPGFGCPWFCARHHKANPDKYAKQQGVEQNRAKKKAETTVHNRTSSTLVMASSRGNWPHSLRVAAAKVWQSNTLIRAFKGRFLFFLGEDLNGNNLLLFFFNFIVGVILFEISSIINLKKSDKIPSRWIYSIYQRDPIPRAGHKRSKFREGKVFLSRALSSITARKTRLGRENPPNG